MSENPIDPDVSKMVRKGILILVNAGMGLMDIAGRAKQSGQSKFGRYFCALISGQYML